MERLDTDTLVIGGGAVGLAVARVLCLQGREVILIEAGDRCGAESSTRNNQVVHAGFLYPPASLKARLCRVGHDALIEYAATQGVPFRMAPKLMLAIDDVDLPALDILMQQGKAAGVEGLERLDAAGIAALEPAITARGAIVSAQTAIIDAAALIEALEGEVLSGGGLIATRTKATGGLLGEAHHLIDAEDSSGERMRIGCRNVVIAAGLGAADMTRALTGVAPQVHFAKGQFLSHRGATGLRHLVVPLGLALGQGAALSHDIGGQERFGPDQGFVDRRDYNTGVVHPDTIAAIRRWYPAIDADRLAPEFAGIRPRLSGPGQEPGDWSIDRPARGVVTLLGIDTPGLTACLSIADHVAGLLQHTHQKEARSA